MARHKKNNSKENVNDKNVNLILWKRFFFNIEKKS